ncbi:serine/threonine-protein kinase HipA [Pseudomonas helmanticensis]|uniref:Serine/threonine-protein kinase HipA n=1 Tax=Pseudomonas helmanticensis TaxID=1471381 RepID=A0ACD2U9W4_9PSED|nr:HipA domain-containing protein [Pseudomonas helmanticensis]SMQ28191.1 serine/threonine-protein kinase HipA [Pseudomonas helmanticensis]
MYNLTLQIFTEGKWRDAMILSFDDPEKGFESRCSFGYETAYLVENIEAVKSPFSNAVSALYPLDWEGRRSNTPAFLYDIAPAGAAKKFLLARLGQEKPADISADLYLLGRSTPAPIGNMRIKESAEVVDEREPLGFKREDVVLRDSRFLEYAYELGAAIGGATGAGGEAPKLLLAESKAGLLYPDAVLDDEEVRQHWFVKFSRNKGGVIDQDILRSEFHYYKALQALGIETIAVEGLALEEASKPSLWMHRFDRKVTNGEVSRIAVESIYSMAEVTIPGSAMNHMDVIRMLAGLWRDAGQAAQIPELVADYLRRDLINKILGNNDNHGRNIAILRQAESFRLAPIYDLAPMVMDPEGLTRTTKWSKDLERAGEVDWRGVCRALADISDPEDPLAALADAPNSFERLREDAQRLAALPDILMASGLPDRTMNHPGIHLKNLEQRLKEWDLK